MYFITRHHYGAGRRNRAKILASTASDTARFVDYRHKARSVGIGRINRRHLDRPGGTFTGAFAAIDTFRYRQTLLVIDMGISDVYRRLFSLIDL